MTLESNSLMAGWDQPDVAALQDGDGTCYRCYVWLNRVEYRVEALCKARQPDGTWTVVFHNLLDTADLAAVGGTAGYPLDCPRVIACGSRFVATWLRATTTDDDVRQWTLQRASMNMDSFDASIDGWTASTQLAIYEPYGLYDLCPVLDDADGDYIIARATAVDTITVERFTFGHTLLWTTDITRNIEGRVLAVYAHEPDNDVLVTYERSGDEPPPVGTLWTAHLDANNGSGFTDEQTFELFAFTDPNGQSFSTPGAYWISAGHCRTGTNTVAVVAEALLRDLAVAVDGNYALEFIHHIVFRELGSDTAQTIGNEHWCPHLSLVSRPWAFASGTSTVSPTPDVYVAASYKSVYDRNDWAQATIFALNLNYGRWQGVDSGQVLRPRPIATLASTSGIPDARVGGWHPEGDPVAGDLAFASVKRCNHISSVAGAPPFGDELKTRTVAVGMWARMNTVGIDTDSDATEDASELQPENLGVTGFTVYMEDPWVIRRDPSEPTQAIDNFKAAYSRSMFQTAEIGRALAMFNGAPALYDGEQTVELGYFSAPEIFQDATLTAGMGQSGELTTDSTYLYYAVKTWRDNAGQLHRSPPSLIHTVTLTGSDNLVVLRIRTDALSLRDASSFYPLAQSIQLEIFRTEADGSVFYRVFGASVLNPNAAGNRLRPRDTPINDPQAIYGFVDVYDGLSDARLVLQGAAPFTVADDGFVELTPQVVPALNCPAVWQSRLWGADQTNMNILWYSDQILPDFGSEFYRAPEFNGRNTFRIDGIGEVTALKPMGDALYIFTRSAIYALRGQCNDGNGEGADLSLEQLHEGIGCVEPRSVVLAPQGIGFQSSKGYYWLDRGGSLDYLTAGASIEDDVREAGNIRAATLLENRNQIRLVCNGRPVTTYTTTWTVDFTGSSAPGDWSITLTGGTGSPGLVATATSTSGTTEAQVADQLAADIASGIADRSLLPYFQSVSSPDATVVVVWQPDVVPSYADSNPADATLVGVDTSDMQVQPRVLLIDYLQRRTARAELLDVSSTERLNEAVGGTAWYGASGDQCHVVLQQGALRIEYPEGHATVFADGTAIGGLTAVRMRLKTAPIHLAGLAGYKRVRRVYVQTSKPDASQFNVNLDYYWTGNYGMPDDEDDGVTVQTITPDGLEICPRHQKLQAIGVEIVEPVGVAANENIVVHAITFLAGVKKGVARRSDARRGAA